jgi:hypothetical protein
MGSWIAWGAAVLVVWVAVALVVGLLISRVIRHRDRQVPGGGAVPTAPLRTGTDDRDAPAALVDRPSRRGP